MSKRQIKLVQFVLSHKDWHTYASDRETVGLICATANLGIIKLNEYHQFRLKSHLKARDFLAARGC